MVINGYNCKFVAKLASDGRLYNGVWLNTDHAADFFPPGTVVLDDFPTDETAKDGGSDYKLVDGKLVYDPVPPEERARRRKEIYLEKTGMTAEEYAAKFEAGGAVSC